MNTIILGEKICLGQVLNPRSPLCARMLAIYYPDSGFWTVLFGSPNADLAGKGFKQKREILICPGT